ncbi:DUF1579 family protein [Acanthopleuribacter pedis]|uniref:DUF1579 family protein n=1 Tax=Acanthopleuribacter pedis TaxID=442870 RepID=A0A8J7QIT6_9BACT|nr:DUF1579 family protein [Acanthopleuribacter pedis]MBO1321551.1 DUF1579 family protein [Acanthopleuribacter pedis]
MNRFRTSAAVFSALLLLCFPLFAAESAPQQPPKPQRPCDTSEGGQLDFWVGDWALTWKDAKGNTQTGSNKIEKVLNQCIIQENFNGPGLEGRSWSVYDPKTKQWRQTWVDSNGSYLEFTGAFADGKMELRMPATKGPDGKSVVRRMVFHDIKKDSLTWSWQSTNDGGKTWKDLWVIQYKRKA